VHAVCTRSVDRRKRFWATGLSVAEFPTGSQGDTDDRHMGFNVLSHTDHRSP
jgi:hypothetical protein